MAPQNEKSSLKRNLKKQRRSQRTTDQDQSQTTPVNQSYLPTPLTQQNSTTTDVTKEVTASPGASSQVRCQTPLNSDSLQTFSSPPGDTQAQSQFVYPPRAFADEVEDEAAEGVWGYLIPLDEKVRRPLVLRKRDSCEGHADAKSKGKAGKATRRQDKSSEDKQAKIHPPGGYLVGRHPECGKYECKAKGGSVAIMEDLSSNGTFINDAIVGRNKHRELEDGDEVTILDEARFVFRYPRTRETSGFRQQYRLLQQLGKGHFATVYLCAERSTGTQYAVKVFEKRPGDSQKSQVDALQQEIGLLMGVSHPNLLCLKDTFDESDGVYLVLELAPEGELFNLIVSKQKFSETETRHIFVQLFEGLKYLSPYTLAQQIKMGRFDYPSPYWDSVGDPALDLIDKMLTVDVDKRITVDECLEHPWLTGKYPSVSDSTDGLTGALGKLDFSKRKIARERTLLSSVNYVHFSEHVEEGAIPIKVFHKNNAGKRVHNRPAKAQKREVSPDENSAPYDFVNLGERGDPVLFKEDSVSQYR
ncbi:unnamed protein product [Aspergillus oryzae]|uniref:Unnamed protein product n=2 Tax=Aspergillus oryzae TaxID=5062 RepID=A0AAN4YUY7_ASPOZ|nr:unnamed protein product [Aspergillus oryzae]GMF86917.1 unnamed protein product [Aspergillus oryzae]GMG12826.1 unnamed protein product [Aspergillus oryzae]GMG35362.1 unnamed protein product [Aspergillus oryzae]GMG53006.1 unnamed protein product [Aspergillus oryzae var. brunneus]